MITQAIRGSAALATALAVPAISFAQAQVPPAMATLPGICTFSLEQTVATSQVGRYVSTRMQQLTTQVNDELNPMEASLQSERQRLETAAASLTVEQRQQQAGEWGQKLEQLQRLAQQRQTELEVTRARVLQRLEQEAGPLINQALQERQCSIVFHRDAVVFVTPAMDITGSVVQKLDAKIQTLPFERERMEQQAQQAAPASPAAPQRR